jgi:hypothetical protein
MPEASTPDTGVDAANDVNTVADTGPDTGPDAGVSDAALEGGD